MSTLRSNAALVVLSGGQDSTTCLFWAKQQYEEVHAVTFNYGQRHIAELDAARKVAELAGVASHEIVDIPNILVSASPLTSANKLDEYASFEAMEAEVGDRVEKTFVPMRNTLFFTIAANRAVALGCGNLVTGICEEDNANYPDCREGFRATLEMAFNQSLGLFHTNMEYYLRVRAPLMRLSKAQTINFALTLPGCMYALAFSHTSYDGLYPPTGKNHANLLRAKGFEEAGVPDPLVVRAVFEGVMEPPKTDNYEYVRGWLSGTYTGQIAANWMHALRIDCAKAPEGGE